MKKINTGFILLTLFSCLTFLSSCTKHFEEINTDKTKITALAPAQLDKLFSTAEYAGITNTDQWAGGYQLLWSLASDEQAQFFSCTQVNFVTDRNVMVGRYLDIGWNDFLIGATTLAEILKQTGPDAVSPDPLREAVAKVWKVYSFMQMTDFFGAIPYSQVGSGEDVIMYDSQEAIYEDFFKILTEATEVLSQNTDKTAFATGDVIYGGNLSQWLKMCNSLRLRAAIRISKVNPGLAKTQGEAAVTAAGGLLIANADNALMKQTPPIYMNPLGVISDWGEFRMSAAMESVLKGYEDPRLPKYFEPAEASGKFKGIRNGMTTTQMAIDANSNEQNSNVVSRYRNANMLSEPHILMVAAETWFNLAEAAVNGWNIGGKTAKECYEGGITASMAQWEAPIGGYLTSTKTPIALNDLYSTPAMSNIPVAFGAAEDVQREQIGTQKWLSLYPSMSPEAWAEFRRTGYPKLYPRLNNDNLDASVEQGSVKRLIYPPGEVTVNKDGYKSGVELLGGPDKTSTLLWWDK